jgi:hypothetical protein
MGEPASGEILFAGRARTSLPRTTINGYGEAMALKEEMAASLPGITSLRDFGGCYLVYGRYLLNPVRRLKLRFSSMIDVNPLPEYLAAVDQARLETPDTEFETVRADFRDPSLFARLRVTDAALLYEVLLHQENYVEVMRNVCERTAKFICIAQPCLRETFFTLPAGAVMLQFYDEPLKDLLRAQSFWPKEPRVERFTPAHWMWGQTISHLVAVMQGFGWDLRSGRVIENVCGPNWEYPLMVFGRR